MDQITYNKLRKEKSFPDLYDENPRIDVLRLEREYSRDFMDTAEVQMEPCDYWNHDLELKDKKTVELAAMIGDSVRKWFQLSKPAVFPKEHVALGSVLPRYADCNANNGDLNNF